MKVLLLRDRFSHMGQHSGYDQLCVALAKIQGHEYVSFWRKTKVPFASVINLIKRNVRSYLHATPFYGLPSLYLELRAAWHAYISSADVIHVLYLEDCLGFLPYLKRRFFPHTRLIATAHQPPSWWKINRITPHWLDALDGLIVLDSASRDFFSRYIAPSKIHFIPHGVDTVFFHPLPHYASGRTPRCLFVGQWLRDFLFLENVIMHLHAYRPDIQFDLVFKWQPTDTLNPAMVRLARNPGVHFHSNLTDLQLQGFYQNAAFLVLPLLDSTANNAILEAMASGLPVFTTAVGGVPDYLTPEGAMLFEPEQTTQFADTLLNLIDDAEERARLSKAMRKRAENEFDWNIIARKTADVYLKITN